MRVSHHDLIATLKAKPLVDGGYPVDAKCNGINPRAGFDACLLGRSNKNDLLAVRIESGGTLTADLIQRVSYAAWFTPR